MNLIEILKSFENSLQHEIYNMIDEDYQREQNNMPKENDILILAHCKRIYFINKELRKLMDNIV